MTAADSPSRAPIGLLVASTLAWLWGILFALTGLAVAIPNAARHGFFSFLALSLFFAAPAFSLCYVGYGLRRARRSAGWVALAVGGLLILLPFAYRATITFVGFGVNLAIVGLTIRNWRHLAGSGTNAAV